MLASRLTEAGQFWTQVQAVPVLNGSQSLLAMKGGNRTAWHPEIQIFSNQLLHWVH